MKRRILSLVLSLLLMVNPLVVSADETQQTSSNGSLSCTVNAIIEDANSYIVTVPKTLEVDLTDMTSEYEVSIEGNLDRGYSVIVEPDESFEMISGSKRANATVEQDRMSWNPTDINIGTKASGVVTVDELTVGAWSGTFNFTINLINTLTLEPGTYDASWNMIASWAELEAIDIDDYIETDSGGGGMMPNGITRAVLDYPELFEGMRKIILGNSITRLGDFAFVGRRELEDILLPESLTSINHTSLGEIDITEITIPSSVTFIYGWGFKDSDDLRVIYYNGSVTQYSPWGAENATVLTY